MFPNTNLLQRNKIGFTYMYLVVVIRGAIWSAPTRLLRHCVYTKYTCVNMCEVGACNSVHQSMACDWWTIIHYEHSSNYLYAIDCLSWVIKLHPPLACSTLLTRLGESALCKPRGASQRCRHVHVNWERACQLILVLHKVHQLTRLLINTFKTTVMSYHLYGV